VTIVGELALWVALFLAVWGSVTCLGGALVHRPELEASGARAIVACAGMTAMASLGLLAALIGHDLSLEYVVSNTTTNTPLLYLVTAFWAGPPGAMLSLALALSLCSAIIVSNRSGVPAHEWRWTAGALAAVIALALGAVCFATNPFDAVEWVPAEGLGLEPRLQTPLAMPYFVATYAAYGAAAGAFARVLGIALVRGADPDQLEPVRSWTLATWALLTVSIALRMRWTYLDPVGDGLWRPDLAQLSAVGGWALAFLLLRLLAVRARPGRRRSAAMLAVYLSLVVLLAGIVAERWWTNAVITLRPGEATQLTDPYGRRWRLVSQGVSRDEAMNHLATSVALEAWRNGARAGIVSAERRQYLDSFQRPIHEPAVRPGFSSSIGLDVYVALEEVRGESAQLRVSFRPLVMLVWIGWALIAISGCALGVGSTPRVDRRDAQPAAAA
jgi:cytochrome c biogenesis factor